MDKSIMDTQELNEIRALIGDLPEHTVSPAPHAAQPAAPQAAPVSRPAAPQEPAAAKPAPVAQAAPQPQPSAPAAAEEGFNLDEILSEVSDVVDRSANERDRKPEVHPRRIKAQTPAVPAPRQVSSDTRPTPPLQPAQPAQPTQVARPAEPPAQAKPQTPVRAPLDEPEYPEEFEEFEGEKPRRGLFGRRRKESFDVDEDDGYDDEDDFELDERDEKRELKRARKQAAREAKQAAREAGRVSREEDEEIPFRSPRQAQSVCARRAKGLAHRSLFVLLMAVLSVYLTLAEGFGLPLPHVLRFSESTLLTVLTMVLLQFLAMFAGIDVVGLGFYNLFTLKPERRSLVAVALLASFLHCVTIIIIPAWSAYLPYCAPAIILLYAMMLEEKNRLAARYRAYKAVSLTDKPVLIYSHLDPEDRPRRAVKYQADSSDAFLRELEKPDYAERFASFYVPLALAAALVLSLLSAFANKEPSRFFLSFSVMMSVAGPIGLICAAGHPYKNVSRRLLGDGAALAGARAAFRLCKSREAILTDSDLFPAGSITIEGIHNYGVYPDEKLLAYATAVTGGLEISSVFADALHRSYGRPVRASKLVRYEGGGISAEIGGDSVIVGTAAFLSRMGIRVKPPQHIENGVFLVVNSYPAAIFNMAYRPSAQTYSGIHTLRRLGLMPVMASLDFNISPAMVASLFELRQGTIEEASGERAAVYNDPNYIEGDLPGALLSRDAISPFANVFFCAHRLASAVRGNLLIGGFAGTAGLLIMFYLTYLGKFVAISPRNILLYMLLWSIPVFFLSLGTRRGS